MKDSKDSTEDQNKESQFSIGDFLKSCAAKKKWFIASVLFFLLVGIAYIARLEPRYERSMSVLIKDQDEGGGVGSIASAFSSFGLVSSNTNVYNELLSIKSPAVMQQVVLDLNLQVNTIERKFPHGTTLYGTTDPFVIGFPDLGPQDGGSFRMDIRPDGTARLYKFRRNLTDGLAKYDDVIELPKGFLKARTPLGIIDFTPNPKYTGKLCPEGKPRTLVIARGGLQATTESLCKRLKGDLADKDAEVIDLQITDVSIERAEDILNNVLRVYNEFWVSDKNKVAQATSQFINDRLVVLQQELGDIDLRVSDFQSKSLMPNIGEVARMNMESTKDVNSQILTLNNQLAMSEAVYGYIANSANKENVIPMNTGTGNPQLEAQIGSYNQLLLQRNNVRSSASGANPIVQQLDAQVAGQHEAITKAMAAHVANLRKALANLQGAKGAISGEIAALPDKARQLRGVTRQQSVKEQLYLFLLQKREENELSQTFTANSTRVITPPQGSFKPVSPKKTLILGVLFIVGLFLPAMVIYIRESNNSKVRSRKDLEHMSAPFIGEIPFMGKKPGIFKKFFALFRKKKHSRSLEKVMVAVRPGSRDVASESFKIIRGNIDFMMQHSKADNVIMLTSFNPGSGKSFIAYNLSASFTMKGKRVLNIDCDLRHGSTSQFVHMPDKGLSSYLTGATDDWRSLVRPVEDTPDMFVLPIGHRPPNPSELLDNGRIGKLIREASEEYDYVFLDCPPVDIVVDTQILEKYIHRTIFIVRAGLLERSAIAEIDALYQSGRFKNMCLLLNGTEQQLSRYGAYGSSSYRESTTASAQWRSRWLRSMRSNAAASRRCGLLPTSWKTAPTPPKGSRTASRTSNANIKGV